MTFIKKFFYDIYIDVVLVMAWFLFACAYSTYNVWFVCGAVLTCVSALLWIIARMQLGNAFSVLPCVRSLKINGLYAKIRHPMYLFSFLAATGIVIMMQNVFVSAVLPIIAVVQIKRMQMENALLQNTYGTEYDTYVKNTWF